MDSLNIVIFVLFMHYNDDTDIESLRRHIHDLIKIIETIRGRVKPETTDPQLKEKNAEIKHLRAVIKSHVKQKNDIQYELNKMKSSIYFCLKSKLTQLFR